MLHTARVCSSTKVNAYWVHELSSGKVTSRLRPYKTGGKTAYVRSVLGTETAYNIGTRRSIELLNRATGDVILD